MKLFSGTRLVAQAANITYSEAGRAWTADSELISDFNKEYTLTPDYPKVSAIEYKMLFTSAERIAAKASVDPVIVDLQELLNDPRTKEIDLSLASIHGALDYMTAIGILAEGRKAQILTGVVY